MNFAKFLRTPFFKEHLRWLHLKMLYNVIILTAKQHPYQWNISFESILTLNNFLQLLLSIEELPTEIW